MDIRRFIINRKAASSTSRATERLAVHDLILTTLNPNSANDAIGDAYDSNYYSSSNCDGNRDNSMNEGRNSIRDSNRRRNRVRNTQDRRQT